MPDVPDWLAHPRELDELTRQRRDNFAAVQQKARETNVFRDDSRSTEQALRARIAAGLPISPLMWLRAGFAENDPRITNREDHP